MTRRDTAVAVTLPPGPFDLMRAAAPALAVAAAALLPFLGKAHTIDDVTFLTMAEHVLRDPLHPAALGMVADGSRIRLSSQLVSGPVMAWLLAPAAALGGSEWAAHIVPLLLLLASALATVSLARRLGFDRSAARLAGLLLVTSPAVLPMATTSMADVPAMAFGILGVERVFAFRDSRRARDGLVASLMLALAALTRSHLALLLPLSWLVLAPRRDSGASPSPAAAADARVMWASAAVPVAALAITVLVARLTADPRAAPASGGFFARALARFDLMRTVPNGIACAAHWTSVTPLGLAWAIARGPRLARGAMAWVALAAAVALVLFAGYGPWYVTAPLVALGAAAVAEISWDALRRGDRDRIFLAACLLMPLAAAGYEQLPPKFVAAAAPMAALLAAAACAGNGWSAPVARAAVARPSQARFRFAGYALAAAGLILSQLIIHADAELANAGRRAASEWIAPRVARGERVWALGNWGFQWYATRAGATPLAFEPPHPGRGDLVAVSAGTRWSDPRNLLPPADQIDERVTESTLGRITSGADGAGYYSNFWGLLPWVPGNGVVEAITLWRVK